MVPKLISANKFSSKLWLCAFMAMHLLGRVQQHKTKII